MAQPMWSHPQPMGPFEWLPALDVPEPARQRRWTVLLRWLLLIPQFFVVVVLGICAFFVMVAGWFCALFTGALPGPIARFLAGYLGYETRVHAAAMLLVDHYPPFAMWPGAAYPVHVEVRPGPLNRLAVFFRLILLIPAAIVQSLVMSGWYALAVIIWIITLVLGRLPRPLFEATAAALRYSMRFTAYVFMLTSAYPKRLFGDEPEKEFAAQGTAPGTAPETAPGTAPGGEPGAVPEGAWPSAAPRTPQDAAPDAAPGTAAASSATRPLVMSTAGQVLVAVFLVVGLASTVISNAESDWNDDSAGPAGTTVVTVS